VYPSLFGFNPDEVIQKMSPDRKDHLTCVLKFIALSVISLLQVAMAASPDNLSQKRTIASGMPQPNHIVIVIEENKSYKQIIGNMAAQYINRLANEGALFTNSFAVMHPSQPNYLALFSGSTHGVPDDRCSIFVTGDNLASELRKKGFSFGIYSESMPSVGYEGCFTSNNYYARKHNPVVNWQGKNIPPEINMPFDKFPSDYTKLPTVSMVVPNQINDMHDGRTPLDAIIQGDVWLKNNLDSYVRWAKTNNSLLIVTWDEDDDSSNNQIPTIFVGPMVKPGKYNNRINHYNVLRTIIDMYELAPIGHSTDAKPIVEVWERKK